jgi:hypothetical protein
MAGASNPSISTKIQHVDGGDSLVVKTGGILNVEAGGKFEIAGVDLAASLAAKANDAARYVAAGATKALTPANNNQTVKLDTAAGSAVTLPAATGSGCRFKFLVTLLATSAAHIISAAGADVMIGAISGARIDSGNAVLGFAAQSTSNTITLNRTTTGSVSLGEYVEVEDVAAGIWEVTGFLTATGAAFATPFSHV